MKRKKQKDQVERVLLYHLDEKSPKGAAVRALLSQMSIPCLTAQEADLSQTVGHLVEMDGFPPSQLLFEGEAPQVECMVIRGLSSTKMDRLLQNLRAMGIQIPLKAMVTQVNRDWKLIDLIAEIQKEHQLMHRAAKK